MSTHFAKRRTSVKIGCQDFHFFTEFKCKHGDLSGLLAQTHRFALNSDRYNSHVNFLIAYRSFMWQCMKKKINKDSVDDAVFRVY